MGQQEGPITGWPKPETPRAKMMQHGATALSDAELIAVVIGSGSRLRDRRVSAVELGRQLLKRFGSLRRISRRDARELMNTAGVGSAKAMQLAGAFEIGRRIQAEPASTNAIVRSPADVAAVYGPEMRDLHREVFRVVLLNTAHRIVTDHIVSVGGLAASIVEPREVFRHAILESAAAIICLHNHPSGNPEPSHEDLRVTRQLVEAGRVMGIPVHDHLIIAGDSWTSLAERGQV